MTSHDPTANGPEPQAEHAGECHPYDDPCGGAGDPCRNHGGIVAEHAGEAAGYDSCPPAASHTCGECKRVLPRCPQCGDAIGHALRPCAVCNPGAGEDGWSDEVANVNLGALAGEHAGEEAGGVRGWWSDKTVAEIIHEYAVVRGDLTEQYARDQLTRIIEERLRLIYDDAQQILAARRAEWEAER